LSWYRKLWGREVIGTWLRTIWFKVVGSISPWQQKQIFNPRLQNINKAPSVRVIVICSDHRLLWRKSYKGVDHALTSDKSILQKIIVIIMSYISPKWFMSINQKDYLGWLVMASSRLLWPKSWVLTKFPRHDYTSFTAYHSQGHFSPRCGLYFTTDFNLINKRNPGFPP